MENSIVTYRNANYCIFWVYIRYTMLMISCYFTMLSFRWCAILVLCINLTTCEITNKGWWRNIVFYQVYPRSFMDYNNDGTGDLKGITEKLEHFVDAGIGAIWLSPIYASPMVDFGYDISNFREIDQAFGTMDDLIELTTKAKNLGIKVVMDLVPNHTSDKHEWFVKSVEGGVNNNYTDYYIWKIGQEENSKPPNNWISEFKGPAWTLHPNTNAWYFHQFEYRQPDLNYNNPHVQREMEDIIKFWLEKGIDGFRIDSVPHLYEDDDLKNEPLSGVPGSTPNDLNYLKHIYTRDDPRNYKLVQSWRSIVDEYAYENNLEEKVILTEAYSSLENTTKFYRYGSHVPFNFNFIVGADANSTPSDFKNIIDNWMSKTPSDGVANWVIGNHDRVRTATRYPGRADQMTMLTMILPGIAVTYNGEEIAMEDKDDITFEETQDPQGINAGKEGYKKASRDPCRTPFQWDNSTNAGFSKASKTWLPVNANYQQLNLANQKNDNRSHYKLYQKLTALRKTEVLQSGTLTTGILDDDVLAVTRHGTNETIILLINFLNDKEKAVNIAELTKDYKIYEVYVSNNASSLEWESKLYSTTITLQAKESLVLKIRNSAFLAEPVKVLLVVALCMLYRLI